MLLAEGRRKGCLSCDRLFISESLLYGSEHSEGSCGQAAESGEGPAGGWRLNRK